MNRLLGLALLLYCSSSPILGQKAQNGSLSNPGGGTQPFVSGQQTNAFTYKFLKGPQGANNFNAIDVNDHREITGYGRKQGTTCWIGLYWSSPDTEPIQFQIPGASCTNALGIDNAGNIVGFYSTAACNDPNLQCGVGVSGFLRHPDGTLTYPIDFPGALSTTIHDINSAGEMVGTYRDVANCTPRAFFRNSAGVFSDISPPGSTMSQARCITDAGRIGGTMEGVGPALVTGWTLEAGTYFSVLFPGDTYTSVEGMSDLRNELIGGHSLMDPFPSDGGFIRRGRNGIYLPLSPPATGSTFHLVAGMNEQGDIVGISGGFGHGSYIALRISDVLTR